MQQTGLADIFTSIVNVIQTHGTHKRLADMQEKHHQQEIELQQSMLVHIQGMRDRMNGQSTQAPVFIYPAAMPTMQPMQPMAAQAPQQAVQPAQPTQTVTGAVEASKKAPEPYSKYAPDMDVSVGCIPCTRAHLSTIAASLRNGNATAAREEMTALLEYDLTPEKLARTPEAERKVLEKYAGEMDKLKSDLDGDVPEMTVASASLKESLRFAREDGIQHPEVQERMARAEDAINELERVKLAPEKLRSMDPDEAKRLREALPEIRRARQDLVNNVKSPEDLEKVTAEIAKLDQQLNPEVEPGKLNEARDRATKLNTDFRHDVLSAWKEQAK